MHGATESGHTFPAPPSPPWVSEEWGYHSVILWVAGSMVRIWHRKATERTLCLAETGAHFAMGA